MERRTFLQTVAAGIGASLVGAAADAQEANPPHRAAGKRAIVAGAGITGLCCAYELMQRGIDVTQPQTGEPGDVVATRGSIAG